jgi:hypothetical protein
MKCKCPSETHGHEAGKCNNLATEPDRMCKPCHDSWADEAVNVTAEPLSEPARVAGVSEGPYLIALSHQAKVMSHTMKAQVAATLCAMAARLL